MKSTVDRELNSMSKGYIRDTCGKFRSKLEACIVAQRTDLSALFKSAQFKCDVATVMTNSNLI